MRLGFLADLLSRPVLVGYMAGVAVIMIGSQLGKVTGVPVEGDEFVDQVRSFVDGLDGVHWPTVALAVAVLVVLLVARAGGAAGSRAADRDAAGDGRGGRAYSRWTATGSRSIGEIPAGLPVPGLPGIAVADLSALLIPAAGHRDRRVLRQRADRPRVRGPPGPADRRQRGAAGAGRLQRRSRSAARVPGELQRQPHRARRRARQPHPAVFGGRVGVSCSWCMVAGRGVLANFPMAALGRWWCTPRCGWSTCRSSSGWRDFGAAS